MYPALSLALTCLILMIGHGIARAESTAAFDSALGFTSNANLSSDQPISDFIFDLGASTDFTALDTNAFASARFSNYSKFNSNDLLSLDLGGKWSADQKTYLLKASLKDYVSESPATTDQGFSNFSISGNIRSKEKAENSRYWKMGPSGTTRFYYSSSSRFDFDFSYLFENGFSQDSGFTFSATPGLLISSDSEFSRLHLTLSAFYDDYSSANGAWGLRLDCVPSLYLNRSAGETISTIPRSKKGAAAVTLPQKESLFLVSPGIWKSWDLSESFELRADANLNLQTSKSGEYDYQEFLSLISLSYFLNESD